MSLIHRFRAATRPGRPTLLLLHGTGGSEDDLVPLGDMLLPGAALLSPRGDVLERGMPRFFRRLSEGVFDIPDLIARTHALGDFVVQAADDYAFNPLHVVAVGFSNGANIAASLLLLRPEVLRGAVLFHAQVPFTPEVGPRLDGVHVLLTAGRHDPLIPQSESAKLATLLTESGASVETAWNDGGHALVSEDVDAARAWLHARRDELVTARDGQE